MWRASSLASIAAAMKIAVPRSPDCLEFTGFWEPYIHLPIRTGDILEHSSPFKISTQVCLLLKNRYQSWGIWKFCLICGTIPSCLVLRIIIVVYECISPSLPLNPLTSGTHSAERLVSGTILRHWNPLLEIQICNTPSFRLWYTKQGRRLAKSMSLHSLEGWATCIY